jgi:hypothetical protein
MLSFRFSTDNFGCIFNKPVKTQMKKLARRLGNLNFDHKIEKNRMYQFRTISPDNLRILKKPDHSNFMKCYENSKIQKLFSC